MAGSRFVIAGRVRSRISQRGIPGVRVEAWDKDLEVDDMVGSAVTDAGGAFQIEFEESYFRDLFLDREPDLFFRVFEGNRLIKSTENSVLWNVAAGTTEVLIEVDLVGARPVPPSAQHLTEPHLIRLDPEKQESELKVGRATNPLSNGTLGDTGLAVEVGGREEFALTILRIPFDLQALAGLDAASIRVFRWDEKQERLTPVWNSGINIDHGFIWAKITRPGIHVPLGLPDDPLLKEALRGIARERRVADTATQDRAHEITQNGLAFLREIPADALDDLREFITRLEFRTASARPRPGKIKLREGGHLAASPLPHNASIEDFQKRLTGIRTPVSGLPEEELFYPPDTVRNGLPPWAVSPGAMPWRGVEVEELRNLKIATTIDIARIWPWLISQDWWMYQHDAQHSGHASGASDITSTNVATMVEQPPITVQGNIVSKPSIVGGKIYIGSSRSGAGPGGILYKFDLATGTKEGEFPTSGTAFYSYQGIGGSPTIVNGKVYFTGVHGTVYCVDAATMTPAAPHPPALWTTDLKTANQPKNQPVTNPHADSWTGPLVVNDRVYVGCGEGESATTYGFIFCLDANDGHVIWLFCTNKFTGGADNTPNKIPTAVAAAWAAGAGFAVAANPAETGCSVWSSPGYDATLRRIYVGTGNSQYPHTAQPDDLYGSGLISLDADTGAFRGFFQPTPDDSYWPGDSDIDVSGSPLCFSHGGTRVVAFGSKNGSFFLLNADTLAPIARRQLLPRTGGTGVPGNRGNPIQAVVPTGPTGENSFGVMATPALHSGLGRLFVGIGGYNGMALDAGAGIDQTRTPFLRAVDWNTLADVWPTAVGTDNVSRYTTTKPPMYTTLEVGLSSPAVVNDVVFVSTNKTGLYALCAVTGTCLWSAPGLPTAAFGEFALGPAIYGNYVVMGSGSTLYIYHLPTYTIIWPWPILYDPFWKFRPPEPDPEWTRQVIVEIQNLLKR
jgi:outer membrane protein assembly factor BamB